uniref:rRNA-processing protein UTP23 homolog n=1 Tax=Haemonchus contortus TaxID=6289 RepID=A0A7I4YN93_HAECO
MKVKRLKRANRILTFFKYNYKIIPPFRVLVDGTFTNAALANKINLREQLPKYLGGDVEIVTTKCVLAELESLGSPVYGALVIARQFDVDVCPHTPSRPAAECLAHLARRATKGKTRYVIATNDDSLSEKLRTIAGTPILYIKYNAILLDRVSEISKNAVDDIHKNELESLKAIKAAVLGEQTVKKKKKKIKGVNPLSCKKKKKVDNPVVPVKTGERTASGKRKRSKRKSAATASPPDVTRA